MKLTISLAQMEFIFGDVDINFARADEWITEAAKRGSDLVLLPELWASGYDLENWKKYASPLGAGSDPITAYCLHHFRYRWSCRLWFSKMFVNSNC